MYGAQHVDIYLVAYMLLQVCDVCCMMFTGYASVLAIKEIMLVILHSEVVQNMQ